MNSERLDSLLAEYAELEQRLADPAIHADQNTARRVGRRFAELTPIAKTEAELSHVRGDLSAAREFAADDPDFAAEAAELEARLPELEERLAELLMPRDPNDAKDVILEIKAGEGGEESALFAGDLLRMYLRYAERHGWATEVLDSQDSDLGGYKDVAVAVKTRGVPDGGNGVWSRLKWEGGVHRVQRVPVTESQGRIHTSAAGVLVTPEAEEAEVEIDQLRAKLAQLAEEQAAASASDARRAQIRTVDRSERIRTYNFPQNRISDHRIGYTAYNLDLALAGDMDGVLDALTEAERQARLAGDTQLVRK
jgi:peptide chain release factor 1